MKQIYASILKTSWGALFLKKNMYAKIHIPGSFDLPNSNHIGIQVQQVLVQRQSSRKWEELQQVDVLLPYLIYVHDCIGVFWETGPTVGIKLYCNKKSVLEASFEAQHFCKMMHNCCSTCHRLAWSIGWLPQWYRRLSWLRNFFFVGATLIITQLKSVHK